MTRTRIFILGFFGAVALIAVLIAIIYFSLRGGLDQARSRWDQKGSTSYTLVVSQGCFCAITGEYRITVQAGTVIAAENLDGTSPAPVPPNANYLSHFQPLTVEGMLKIAGDSTATAITAPWLHEFSITYDPTYGYVTDYSSDANGVFDRILGRMVTDTGYTYTARDLVITPP